jgi:catalase
VAAASDLAAQAVDAIHGIYGSHEGSRAVHAKGTLLKGTFTPTPEAAALSSAPFLSEPVPAVVRVSNGGGNPDAPDFDQDGRGLAVKLSLPDGSTTDLVTTSLPAFIARTPEDFVEFTRARKPDPETGYPDGAVVGAYIEKHPEAMTVIQHLVASKPPESYATVRFVNPHTFLWSGAGKVRWRWEPEAGERGLEPEAAAELGPDYLQEEILERAAAGGAAWRLVVVIGTDGDSTSDPTEVWPDDRETVDAGRLELTGPETERETGDDVLVFDPTRLCDGIELSDDPIVSFRHHAYAESVALRSGVQVSW